MDRLRRVIQFNCWSRPYPSPENSLLVGLYTRELVHNIPVTESNYSVIWKILEKRFKSLRLAETLHAQKILHLQKVDSGLIKFVMVVEGNLSALEAQKFPVAQRDFLLLNIAREVGYTTQAGIEVSNEEDVPSYSKVLKFFDRKARVLDHVQLAADDQPPARYICKSPPSQRKFSSWNKFWSISHGNNSQSYKDNPCFSSAQYSINCHSKFCCQQCQHTHHILIHFLRYTSSDDTYQYTTDPAGHEKGNSKSAAMCSSFFSEEDGILTTILLKTARINVNDSSGQYQVVCALLDIASQRVCETLGTLLISVNISGIGHARTDSRGSFVCEITSLHMPDLHLTTRALILNNIAGDLPSAEIVTKNLAHLKNIPPAGP
ncbi:hypothetical protein PR048_026627 [Dryococelus australis]|uniref:Uncharacterized protein n=1 Tax=Dryococelus australis TaxID=614101 RepID=A0ABQ9GLV9_9NEOP|nr:hypothetical protein PR048_026627 [Dryococelus australis]